MFITPPAEIIAVNKSRIDKIQDVLNEINNDFQLIDLSVNIFRTSEWVLSFAESRPSDFIEVCEELTKFKESTQTFVPSFLNKQTLISEASLSLDIIDYSKNLRLVFEHQMAATIMAELMEVNDTIATMKAMTIIAQESLQCSCAFATSSLIKKNGSPDLSNDKAVIKRSNFTQNTDYVKESKTSVDDSVKETANVTDDSTSAEMPLIEQLQNYGFVILGMGKLGGKELNLSSDVDLIFAFEKEGMTLAKDNQRSISHSQFYTKLAQMLIRLMDEVTEFGRVFPVDARLRPHGDSGPLAMSFSAMENYYQLHGREWERYAWIKARCVAGDPVRASLLLKILKPFVYRKYVDYRIVRSIKKMRDMIYIELKQKGIEQNIKLGRGGIRMIEFVVQTYQLLYAGRYHALKNHSLYPALKQLETMNMVDNEQAEKLYEAYLFLRQLEHRIQMYRCQQTHDLPQDDVGLARIAWSLNYNSIEEFNAALEVHRDYVQKTFETLTQIDDGVDQRQSAEDGVEQDNNRGDETLQSKTSISSSQTQSDESLQDKILLYKLIWQKLNNNDAVASLLNTDDTFLTENVIKELQSYIHSKSYGSISADGKDILQSLIPKLMHYCSLRNDSNISIRRCLKVINSIGQRVLYLELLNSNSTVCQNFVDYVSASQWVCQWLANYPIVIEMLLEKNQMNFSDTLKAYREALENRLKGNVDVELVMDVLRQFHHGQVLKVALSDVQKLAPVLGNKNYDMATIEQVYEIRFKLSILAQSLIETALRISCEQIKAKFNVDYEKIKSSFGIIAYGKLGTEELSYDSDLDLVFVFDDQCDLGDESLDRSYYFIRLARKLISILSLPTASGVLYEIDSRLRPSGNSGLLVTSLAKFEKYQKNEAWVWEHQALQKSRMIYGSESFISQFETIRSDIMSTKRDDMSLAEDVANMREKMKKNALGEKKHGKHSYKHMDGGLVDIEFFCQYMILKYGHEYNQLTKKRKVKDILESLHEVKLIDEKDKVELAKFYTLLLFLENHEKLFVQNDHDTTILKDISNKKEITKTGSEGSDIDNSQNGNERSDAELALDHFSQTHKYVSDFCHRHYLSKISS